MNFKIAGKTLNTLNFHMPAEWEPHTATWLGWPHELTDWPGKFAPIPWAFAEIVRHLARVERVFLLVENAAAEAHVTQILAKAGANVAAVDFFRVPTDRGWMRDSGPLAVVDAGAAKEFKPTAETPAVSKKPTRLALLNFAFNGWAKYHDHKKDARVVSRVTAKLKRRVILPQHRGR